MPELSIIVPVYKTEKYLPKCIDSILAQTFTDFELILIDDGSPDRCGEICDEYAAKDDRIIVIHQKNQGVSAARNAGLDIAKGEYIGFVDSDDWIEPEMYEMLWGIAKERNTQVVACGLSHSNEDGVYLFSELDAELEYGREELLRSLFAMPNQFGGCLFNKIYNGKTIKGIRFYTDVQYAEDRMYLLNCYNKMNFGVKIQLPLYHVTERKDSATHKRCADVPKKMIAGSHKLFGMSRTISKSLSKPAMDKLLDDYLRHVPIIKQIHGENGEISLLDTLIYKMRMMALIGYAGLFRLLPREKIHGYFAGCIRL